VEREVRIALLRIAKHESGAVPAVTKAFIKNNGTTLQYAAPVFHLLQEELWARYKEQKRSAETFDIKREYT
jgi:hypothetical protein